MNIKALLLSVGAVSIVGVGGVAGYAALQPALTPLGLKLGDVNLGGLTKDDLKSKLQAWWEEEKGKAITPTSRYLTESPEKMSFEQLGVRPDFTGTVAAAPFTTTFSRWFGYEQSPRIRLVWTLEKDRDHSPLVEFVKAHTPSPRAAKVKYVGGKVVVEHEVPRMTMDEAKLGGAIIEAANSNSSEFEIPMKVSEPKIPNEKLDQITDVVSSFTTSFNSGQSSRSGNIRIAATKLNGVILMPGETLSYNEVVGPRDADEGYRMAPVYVSGRHEMGFGGGICQTVTTLFNAALLANLEIVKRQNHSMPVRYVPLGRDATASYGSIDLVFRNTRETPIAISSEVDGGSLTFRVLGKSDPSVSIRLEVTNHSSWGHGTKTVNDATLAPGTTKVVEKGSTGHSCITWRIVKRDGVEIKREKVASSYYTAFPAIIHKGPPGPATVPPTAPDDGSLIPPADRPKPATTPPKPGGGSGGTNGGR